MPRLIRHDRGNYTNISNQVLRDGRLSWKARGIFCYLWSQSDQWQFYMSEVADHATDGIKSLKSGVHELEQFGYLKRTPRKKRTGDFDGWDWHLDDTGCVKGIPAKKAEKTQENVPNGSDPKGARPEKGQTRNGTLRNNNSKNYQSKEVSKKRNKEKIPYKEIIDYLNQKTGQHLRYTNKIYRQKIKARWKEKYRLADFKKVIDNKAFAWQSTDMWQYMKPTTLFSLKHFDEYLNENRLDKHQSQPTNGGYGGNQPSEPPAVDDDDLPF